MKNRQKVHYIINEENRTVRAYMLLDDLEKEFGELFDDYKYELNNDYRTFYMNKFMAVATCAPEDTFDPKVGMAVARTKLYKQIYGIECKIAAKECQYHIDKTTYCNEMLRYARSKREYYEDLLKKVKEGKITEVKDIK